MNLRDGKKQPHRLPGWFAVAICVELTTEMLPGPLTAAAVSALADTLALEG